MKAIIGILCFTFMVSANAVKLVENHGPAATQHIYYIKARYYETIPRIGQYRLPNEPFKIAIEVIDGQRYIIGAIIGKNSSEKLMAFKGMRGDNFIRFMIHIPSLKNIAIPQNSPLNDRFHNAYDHPLNIGYAMEAANTHPYEPIFDTLPMA